MDSASETFEVVVECLCKAHKFSTTVPKSKLPLLAYACHCNSCRHVTGALYTIGSYWPGPHDEIDTTKLKRYPFSANITMLSCETCSTPLLFEGVKGPQMLGMAAGTLKNSNVDLVKIVQHMHVGDTIDGGATMWLKKPNTDGMEIARYKEGSSGEMCPSDWPSPAVFSGYEKKSEGDTTPIRCHCKGVDFLLHRGNYEGKAKSELPWFIDPKTHKLLASFDACDSCRLQSGNDIFHWTYAELANISLSSAGGSGDRTVVKSTHDLRAAVDDRADAIGTLGYYASSPDVQRYFCTVCSATVFYAVDDRPEMVDIAVGLLDAPDGARAEGTLSWAFGGPVSWIEDTHGGWREGLWKRVQAEAESWRISRGYPKNWRRVEKEEREQKESE